MAKVFIPAQLVDVTGGLQQVEVSGTTLGQIIDQLEEQFPGIQARLCHEGHLHPSLQVAIDDTISTQGLSAPVTQNCEIHFLPAIGGG